MMTAPVAVPNLLILETSGRSGEVAIARGESICAETSLSESRRHARDLAPTVKQLLEDQSLTPRDLHGIIVGIGPGSYTGLRVGIMSAKAMAYAVGCPVIAPTTFEAVAAQSPGDVEQLDVICDAQQGRVYHQSFQRNGSIWTATSDLAISLLDEWLPTRNPKAALSGSGVNRYLDDLPEGLLLIDAQNRMPHALGLLSVGLRQYQSNTVADLWSVEPLYLRPSAAEEQWDRRKPTR